MSPIDDELRAALHGRASTLAPSPDPLAGIERRAQRIQRTRIGAAVAASALAVSAIAVAIPALQSATSSGPTVPNYAASPSAEPALEATTYPLDPQDPWAYRGVPQDQLGTGTLETIAREYAVKRGAAEGSVRLTPLFGQVYEPSQQVEVVFLAEIEGGYRWGVAQSSESGPEFSWDEELVEGQDSLAAALPGDEVARLLVVAAPEATAIEYAADDSSAYSSMAALADGVATVALEGDPATDRYQVTWPSDEADLVSAERPAPDVAGPPQGEEPGTGEPATTLNPEDPWEVRGDPSLVTDGQLEALGEDWANRNGISALVEIEPLYVQRYEADAGVEVVYIVRSGDGPWTWGVASLGEGGWSWYAEHEITEPLSALAAALPGDEGQERLLVVAAPSMGGGMYAADGSDFSPMTDLAAGVFITPIAPGDADDAYLVLDGDGDLDNPVFRGPAPDFQNAG